MATTPLQGGGGRDRYKGMAIANSMAPVEMYSSKESAMSRLWSERVGYGEGHRVQSIRIAGRGGAAHVFPAGQHYQRARENNQRGCQVVWYSIHNSAIITKFTPMKAYVEWEWM